MGKFTYEEWLQHMKNDFDESKVKRDDRGRFATKYPEGYDPNKQSESSSGGRFGTKYPSGYDPNKQSGRSSGGLTNDEILAIRTRVSQIPALAHPSLAGINAAKREASERQAGGRPSAAIELSGKELFSSEVRALANRGKKLVAKILGKINDKKKELKNRKEFEEYIHRSNR
ncbi:MAG: hypothetical protein J6U54_12565 [Clostridiales bacterium]|nr:hypothetical protein [Clostridiales bacterium]